MMSEQDTLLSEIECFLGRSGMTPTNFGYSAVRDPRFVFDLRGGRECRGKTQARARKFMHDHSQVAEDQCR